MTFLIKSSNAQNTTAQNQLKLKEKNPNDGVCKGKATEKLLKSELDRILDKKKYDIRIRMKNFERSHYGDRSLSLDLDRQILRTVHFCRSGRPLLLKTV